VRDVELRTRGGMDDTEAQEHFALIAEVETKMTKRFAILTQTPGRHATFRGSSQIILGRRFAIQQRL